MLLGSFVLSIVDSNSYSKKSLSILYLFATKVGIFLEKEKPHKSGAEC